MEAWQAFVLGIIEGITEYLPISSTGHLLVAQHLMGIGTDNPTDKAAADAFAICIQGGAILAVTGLYWKHVLQMMRGVLGKDAQGLKLAMNILVGFLPAAVIGLLFNDWIEEKLFGMWPIIFAWVVGGVLILVFSMRAHRRGQAEQKAGIDLVDMTWKMALLIGLLQCVAMWPGTSRSLMTIAGGLLVGLSVRSAIEFSFLLGVLTLTAATVKKALWKVPGIESEYDVWFGGAKLMWESYGTVSLVIGVVSATVSAVIAVKWLVSYLQRHGMRPFGYYRIAIGIVMAGLMLGGVLEL
ncbi:MAG: undecaprenyl-diphosphate phosphatase [Akkermansiaceae bacterium]|nr:undecaprenyl-diphosphate phosphatase [Akkermansiaceae bacterium]